MQLDLHTHLPLLRAAFDQGQLQAQTQPGAGYICTYVGPCAIGVMLTPSERESLDQARRIQTLIRHGVIEVPLGQLDDIGHLQDAHDAVVQNGLREMPRFSNLLQTLEAKYARA